MGPHRIRRQNAPADGTTKVVPQQDAATSTEKKSETSGDYWWKVSTDSLQGGGQKLSLYLQQNRPESPEASESKDTPTGEQFFPARYQPGRPPLLPDPQSLGQRGIDLQDVRKVVL